MVLIPLADWLTSHGKSEFDRSEYDLTEARGEYLRRIEDVGMYPVFPEPNELQIDIDEDTCGIVKLDTILGVLMNNLWFCGNQHNQFTQVLSVPSKSNSGSDVAFTHVYVRLPFVIDDTQRIAFQACLGSDPVRELLSLIRLNAGIEHPSMMAETEFAYNAIMEWRATNSNKE